MHTNHTKLAFAICSAMLIAAPALADTTVPKWSLVDEIEVQQHLPQRAPQPLPAVLPEVVDAAILTLRLSCPTLPAGFETEAHVCRVLTGTEPAQSETNRLLNEIADQLVGLRVDVARLGVTEAERKAAP